MPQQVQRVDYYYLTVNDEPSGAYDLLAQLAALGVNLLALNAVPIGPERTQLTLFPEDPLKLVNAAEKARLALDGPHAALLVRGDDTMGALAMVHSRLHEADVSVFASVGVTDGKGYYGYVLYLRPEDSEKAVSALKV